MIDNTFIEIKWGTFLFLSELKKHLQKWLTKPPLDSSKLFIKGKIASHSGEVELRGNQ
jgi:hypothetical protein